MEKWEYKIVVLDPIGHFELEEELNKLGAQGWKMTGIRPMTAGVMEVWYFMRPKFSDLVSKVKKSP